MQRFYAKRFWLSKFFMANRIALMKKTGMTLDKIREGMTAFQKELLQEIWQNFHTKGEWPTLR